MVIYQKTRLLTGNQTYRKDYDEKYKDMINGAIHDWKNNSGTITRCTGNTSTMEASAVRRSTSFQILETNGINIVKQD